MERIEIVFNSVGEFFSNSDMIPWYDHNTIAEIEQAAEEESAQARLSWALVHSRCPEDVRRGIAMVEATLDNFDREKCYILAVGYMRLGVLRRTREMVEHYLEIEAPRMEVVFPNKPITCSLCDRTFVDHIKLDGHVNHNHKGYMKCPKPSCSLVFHKSALVGHVHVDKYKEVRGVWGVLV